MTEREELLSDICANPDDDTPRLVFADWLQENGEPERAEFIRLQCRWAQGPTAGETLSDMNLRKLRELALWEEFGGFWLSELPSSDAREMDWGHMFERGFAGEMLWIRARLVIGPNHEWFRWEATDCSSLPWRSLYRAAPITRLSFSNLSEWRAPLLLPEAMRLKSVCLEECAIDEDSLQTLLKWGKVTEGRLLLRQDQLDQAWEEQLFSGFGKRYQREASTDN
jgi:uncharacterized protein (TIGR02996 family)